MDHSRLEDITCAEEDEDGTYYSDDEEDCERIEDSFPQQLMVANKKCKIYPKSRHYAVIKFGPNFTDTAIALPKVIFHEDEMISADNIMSALSWGHDGWINARRDPGSSSVEWKATLFWTGVPKPFGAHNAHRSDEQWKRLLREYQELGDVDVSLKRVPVPTLKSVASALHVSEKPFSDLKDIISSVGQDFQSNSARDYSYMLEDIDISTRDEQIASYSNRHSLFPKNDDTVTVMKDKQCCGVVQKVEKNSIEFDSIQINEPSLPARFIGRYSMVVQKNNVYVKGEWGRNLELRTVVSPGESFNIISDLLYSEGSKEMFGNIKIAWTGKMPEKVDALKRGCLSDSKSRGDGAFVDNKSLEEIDVKSEVNISCREPQIFKNVGGTVKKVSKSFICILPLKKEFQKEEPYPVMSQNIYFTNGRVGSIYPDLTESNLKIDDYIKMNIAKIDEKLIVLSAWQPGAKCPDNDEAKAAEYAKIIRKKLAENLQKSTALSSRTRLEEPTPPSQMSARPHSPSYYQRNGACRPGELRRPNTVSKPLKHVHFAGGTNLQPPQ